SHGRMADADAVDAVGKQVIGNEFVVAVQVVIADVEFNYALSALREPPHDLDGFKMMRIQFVERRANLRQLDDLRQRPVLNLTNDSVDKLGTVTRLDYQHQTHRRFFEFHGGLRIRELRAVNDIGPMHEVVEVGHWTMKHAAGDVRDEF